MRHHETYNSPLHGHIVDVSIIILVFIGFYFIDVETALFIAVITTALLLTRRVVLDLNPGFMKGHRIFYDEKLLDVPDRVDIFDLRSVPSMEHLYIYIEVIRGILLPPLIFIIRFTEMSELNQNEMDILSEAIRRLQSSGITVIISDIGIPIRNQITHSDIEKKIGTENIFTNIKDAIARANLLKRRNGERRIYKRA